MTKLNVADVRVIADRILSDKLGPSGFTHSDVRAGPDHYDEDSLFVTAHFRLGADVTRGGVAGDAMVALRHALELEGEDRFPYLSIHHPNEDAALEEATASGAR